MEITDDFREKVNKAARSVAGQSQYDWEDVAQDMWVFFLERPAQYENYINLEDPVKELKKVAKQEVHKANNAFMYYSGNYTYTPPEVRGLLGEYLLEPELEAISEHTDLVEGMLMLRSAAQSYFNTIIDKWVNGEEPHHNMVNKAVDRLTLFMNQVNQAARYSYVGVGSRKALTNAQSIARKDGAL